MSEVCLVVRDAQQDLCGTCHGSDADRLVAALAAEPETIDELDRALERFLKPRQWSFFEGFRRGIHDEPWDAGIVVIDLAARLVAYKSTYSAPSHEGMVQYHDGYCATDLWLRYHLPGDWRFTSNTLGWQAEADHRRRQRAAQPPLDARAVLYGKPVLAFIATEALCKARLLRETQLFGATPLDPAEPYTEAEHDAIRDIHARWLTTPRDDLRGQAPRDPLLGKRHFLTWDLQHRADQWSRQGYCPRGLAPDSHGFRFAGFGTHEIVTYYELLRHLLWSCWVRLAEMPATELTGLTRGDFLTAEVPRLEQVREAWMDAPDREFRGITPREIIDHERARLPEGMTGSDAHDHDGLDDDCPLCEMMAELPGPMFWHLDGCNMDDDFAFSFDATREEWEQERREREEWNRRFKEEQAEKERLGVEYPGGGYGDPDYVWQRSFVIGQTDGEPLELRLFGIGANLAELIVDLKHPAKEPEAILAQQASQRPSSSEAPGERRPLIERLSRDFGNLREVAGSTDLASAESLLEPILERFCQTLEAVAAARDDLRPKCDDLAGRLRRFAELPSEFEETLEEPGDEVPF